MKTRTEIINYLIRKCGYTKYLEIGIGDSMNFRSIKAPIKHSVDPFYPSTFNMTSRKFFGQLDDEFYDIIFIDGDHRGREVRKDIDSALEHLAENGIILVHDINPPNKKVAKSKPKEGVVQWFGDGFKHIVRLRGTRSDLLVRTINIDCGIGVIKPVKKKQGLINLPEKITYGVMSSDRRYYLGLISVEEFLNIF